jgi:hypothetical protein
MWIESGGQVNSLDRLPGVVGTMGKHHGGLPKAEIQGQW